MQIYPLQVTSVDWNTYIKVCQETLGFSPTRGIDDLGIKTSSPSAFIQTLDLDNHPRHAIKAVELYNHTFMSFICVMDFDDENIVSRFLRIPVAAVAGNKAELAVYSCSLFDWFNFITLHSNRVVHKAVREFLNIIMTHIERAGFNEIFSNFERIQLNDGTFVVVYK